MKIIHINVNGIPAKKYKMIQLLQELKPEVVGIIETHLKGNEQLTINGYDWVGENFSGAIRSSRGVGFLIKTGIKYKII